MKKQPLSEFCEGLGQNPISVAWSLWTLGAKGQRGNTGHCPLANAIREHTTAWPGAWVYHGAVLFRDPQIMDYRLPNPCAEFIKLFDQGEFPFLDEDVTVPGEQNGR